MAKRNFAVFILTHGRADRVITYATLKRSGYTGPIYLVIDNEDSQRAEYEAKYGDQVLVFDKQAANEYADKCDNFPHNRGLVFGRNSCFKLAKQLGVTHFLELDDDYSRFCWGTDRENNYISRNPLTKRFDEIVEVFLDFLDATPVKCIAFAQGGDYLGVKNPKWIRDVKDQKLFRKAMNSFFFKTDREVQFVGRMNEDVNLYALGSLRGEIYLTSLKVRLTQLPTQKQAGGVTELYKDFGTYVKSFYTVMLAPSCVKLITMGVQHRRIHHAVMWNNACPVILRESYRKPRKRPRRKS